MAQRLGERARGPAEATGLYRAVLLRSGKWGKDTQPSASGREDGACRKQGGHSRRTVLSPWLAGRWALLSFAALLSSFPFSLPSFIVCNYFFFFLPFLHSFLPTFILLEIYP